MYRRRFSVVLGTVALLTMTWCGSASASRSDGRVAREFVAVAHLDPEIGVLVNVVTGRLKLSGDDVGFAESVVAIEDPLLGHKLFRYTGGIPGLRPARGSRWDTLIAPDTVPAWGARVVRRNRTSATIVLADGRKIGVANDASGRVVGVRWPDATGDRKLRTRIGYAGARTAITDPFGVTRTYQHDRSGGAFELVPPSWRGPGYRRWSDPVLDGRAQTGLIQRRTSLQPMGSRAPLDEIQSAAGNAFGSIWFAPPANDGYVNVGLRPLTNARRMETLIRRLGLLDVTDITPTFSTQRSLNAAQNTLDKPLDPLLRDCHVGYGQVVDDIDITVASTITPDEMAVLEKALRKLNAWAVVSTGGPSVCAVPQRAG